MSEAEGPPSVSVSIMQSFLLPVRETIHVVPSGDLGAELVPKHNSFNGQLLVVAVHVRLCLYSSLMATFIL